MPVPFFSPLHFAAELLVTVFSVVFCILIYLKTRESYKLTKHKGIGYFRDAFLFFGLSYVLRFLMMLVMFSSFAFDFFIPHNMFMPLSVLLLGYFSTAGIFYLIFSTIYKRFKGRHLVWVGQAIAVALSAVSFITHSYMILVFLQTILLIVAVSLVIFMPAEKRRFSPTKMLYCLVILLWLLNLWIIDFNARLHPGVKIFFYLMSLAVFGVIYYKISKWTK